jgi:type IV secretion system protein VirD4
MKEETVFKNTEYNAFQKALILFPLIGFFVCTYLCVQVFGAHSNVFWTFPYLLLYYMSDPPKAMLYCYVIMIFSFFVPFGFVKFQEKTSGKYGSAKYAPNNIIKKMNLFNDNGIVLGKETTSKNARIFQYKKSLSSLILAPPGTGKTFCIAIPNIFNLDHSSIVIHDPKGELAEHTIKYRSSFTKVCVFNFALKNSAVFNPFCATLLPQNEDEIMAYARNIANIIFEKNVKKKESYWDDEATNIFLFMALADIYLNKQSSLPRIYQMTKSGKSIREIVEKLLTSVKKVDAGIKEGGKNQQSVSWFTKEELDNPKPKRNLRQQIDNLANSVLQICASDNQMAGVMGTFNTKMSLYSDPIIAVNTSGKNELPITSMRKELHTVYLVVEEKDRDRLRELVTLFLETLVKNLISELPKKDDNRIVFVLDEFVRLRGIDTLKTLPEISRGYNLAGIFIAQDYKQVENVFGREMTDMLETLCAYKVIFKQNNHATAERTAKLIGNYTDQRQSVSSNKNHQDNKSVTVSEEGLQLVTAQDILNLDTGKIIIIAEGFSKYPILASAAHFESTVRFSKIAQKYPKTDYKEFIRGRDLK